MIFWQLLNWKFFLKFFLSVFVAYKRTVDKNCRKNFFVINCFQIILKSGKNFENVIFKNDNYNDFKALWGHIRVQKSSSSPSRWYKRIWNSAHQASWNSYVHKSSSCCTTVYLRLSVKTKAISFGNVSCLKLSMPRNPLNWFPFSSNILITVSSFTLLYLISEPMIESKQTANFKACWVIRLCVEIKLRCLDLNVGPVLDDVKEGVDDDFDFKVVEKLLLWSWWRKFKQIVEVSTWTKCQVYLIKLISVGDNGLGSEPLEPKKSWNLSEQSEAPVVFEANECDLELFDSGTNSVLILILLDFEFPMIFKCCWYVGGCEPTVERSNELLSSQYSRE